MNIDAPPKVENDSDKGTLDKNSVLDLGLQGVTDLHFGFIAQKLMVGSRERTNEWTNEWIDAR